MPRRCPVCREVLLSARVGDLDRCEPCQHYVDPEGAIVDGREGRIRTALAEAGDEPRMVVELEALLGPGAAADELRELCERHRERVRAQLEAVELPESVTLEKAGDVDGDYREAGQRGWVRVTFTKPARGWSDEARMRAEKVAWAAMVVTFGSLATAWFVPSIRGQLHLVAALGGIVLIGAFLILPKARLPVRRLVFEQGRDELEVHLLGGEIIGLPVAETRLRRTDLFKERGSPYLYLLGPGLTVRLVPVGGSRSAAGRLEAARLEDVLHLSGPAPAEEKR